MTTPGRLILPRRRVPTCPADIGLSPFTINWSHPCAPGLVNFIVGGNIHSLQGVGTFDFGFPSKGAVNSECVANSGFGERLKGGFRSADSTGNGRIWHLAYSTSQDGKLSLALGASTPTWESYNHLVYLRRSDTYYAYVTANATQKAFFDWYLSTDFGYSYINSAPTDREYYDWLVTIDTGVAYASATIYEGGISQSVTSTTTNKTGAVLSPWSKIHLNSYNADYQYNSSIGYVAVWDRILSAEEARYFWENPFALVYLSQPIIYSFAGGAASVTVTISTGVAATGAVGSVTVTGSCPVTISTGVDSTGTVESVTVGLETPVVISDGVAATGAVGSVTVSGDANVSVDMTQTSVTGAVGDVTISGSCPVTITTGVDATGSVGSVTVGAGCGVTISTGVDATGAVGSVTVAEGCGVTISTGVDATGSVGSVTVEGSASVSISTGVDATGAVGAVTVEEGCGVTISTGVDATGSVGSVVVSITGDITVNVLSGIDATGAVGSVTVTGDGNVTVSTGVDVTGAVGSVTVEEGCGVTIATGVSATGAVGDVVVTATGGDALVTIATGIDATGAIGSVTVTGDANVTITTGVGATGAIGDVGVTVPSLETGTGDKPARRRTRRPQDDGHVGWEERFDKEQARKAAKQAHKVEMRLVKGQEDEDHITILLLLT